MTTNTRRCCCQHAGQSMSVFFYGRVGSKSVCCGIAHMTVRKVGPARCRANSLVAHGEMDNGRRSVPLHVVKVAACGYIWWSVIYWQDCCLAERGGLY
jgi:hypothetical protein